MTAPLTPADCDLRGLSYMPLDVQRLRDSDLALTTTGDEFKAAVLLWCASWSQVPAASLPDDDRLLAGLCRFELRAWKRVRAAALRGWVKCSDGRLYHPVVAEKAREAWKDRGAYRKKRENDRDRLAAWREAQKREKGASGSADETPTETRFDTRYETQPEEKGTGSEGITEPPNPPLGGVDREFLADALAAYPDAGKGNLSPTRVGRAWDEEASLVGGRRLLEAVRAFAGCAYLRDGGKPRRFDRWLADQAYEVFLGADPAPPWSGPAEVRDALEVAFGEVRAAGYLARCAWRDLPDRAVVTSSETIAATIRREAGDELMALGIAVLVERGVAA